MSAKVDMILRKIRESDVNAYDKGRFANYAAIIAAYPTGEAGWYVINYDTDTFWLWDTGTSAWVNTDRKGEVSSVFGRVGTVTAQSGDYGSDKITFNNTGSSLSSVTAELAIKELDTRTKVFQSNFTSADSTGFAWTDNVLTITHSLNKTNPIISVKDNTGEIIDTYSTGVTDANNIAIYFPIEAVPITGTWNIRIL